MKTVFVLLLIPLICWSQNNNLKSISVETENSSYEFVLLVDHLKENLLDPWHKYELIQSLKGIEKSLNLLDQTEAFTLTKIFIYQAILETQILENLNLNKTPETTLVINVTNKLEKDRKLYSKFESWIIESLLTDWEKRQKAIPIYRRITPWLVEFESNNAKRFRQKVTSVAFDIINQINVKLNLRIRHAAKPGKAGDQIKFSLPKIDAPSTKPMKSLAETKVDTRSRLKMKLKEVTPDDLSPASQEIDKLESAPTYKWKPKD